MSGQHTPGPWVQHPSYPWIIKQDCSPISDEGVSIGSTCAHENSGFFPTPGEGRANARLIAAAPDLLGALQRATEMCEFYADFIRRDVMSVDIERHPYLPELEGVVEDARAAIAKATGATP